MTMVLNSQLKEAVYFYFAPIAPIAVQLPAYVRKYRTVQDMQNEV
jgi:hypothetical protein